MRSACLTSVAGVASLFLASTIFAQPIAPFAECPPVGFSTSCSFLFVVNPDGSVTLGSDPSQIPTDGSDDFLIGVFNNSAASVESLSIFGPGAFAFDGDATYDNFGAVTFSDISANLSAGTVSFNGYFDSNFNFFPSTFLPLGGSTYFILENQPVGVVPEPASLYLTAIVLGAFLVLFRPLRRRLSGMTHT